MREGRSFAEYVKNKCYNGLYEAAEEYVQQNWETMDLWTKNVHRIGSVDVDDVIVQRVYIHDLPEMRVEFEVGLELQLTVHEGDYHYDETDECNPWLRVTCDGDLACSLDDWEIHNIEEYSPKNPPSNSLSDALVPYIPYDKLEDVATEFLEEYYPKALVIPGHGEKPVWVDPEILAKTLHLNIVQQRIRKDHSVFGQIYFESTDNALFYDEDRDEEIEEHVDGKTIVVDPEAFLLRTFGCGRNTVIHECVHWVKHRKVFALEKLFNQGASSISCEVVGGADSAISRSAAELMEKQANQLTPRIQMPAAPFRAKANEYIGKYMRDTNAKHTIDVMEMVITELETDFMVSRQAVKIRLVELGFEEAIGTYTYLDGHYVKPHGFRKGALKTNQTFSVSAQDAAIQRMINPELREKVGSGDYLFVDNHYVYNAPLYLTRDVFGNLDLTDYARSHMDECCLAFDMSIKSVYGAEYHTVCFLNREESDITFEIVYHNGYQNAPQSRQVALREAQRKEEIEVRRKMTDDPVFNFSLLKEWRQLSYMDIARKITNDEDKWENLSKTISRTAKGETSPSLETAVQICFAMNLPPEISMKMLESWRIMFNPVDIKHQWIKEALWVKYPEPMPAVRRYLAQYGVEL